MNARALMAALFGFAGAGAMTGGVDISLRFMFPMLGAHSTRGGRRVRNAHSMRRRYRYAKKRPHRFSALEVADLRSFYMAELNP